MDGKFPRLPVGVEGVRLDLVVGKDKECWVRRHSLSWLGDCVTGLLAAGVGSGCTVVVQASRVRRSTRGSVGGRVAVRATERTHVFVMGEARKSAGGGSAL